MKSNQMLKPTFTELFIREITLIMSLVFTSQPHFKVLKNIRLNAADFLLTRFLTKENFNK